jgi:hypothetical protein
MQAVADDDWEQAINLRVFAVRLDGGDLIELPGWNFCVLTRNDDNNFS